MSSIVTSVFKLTFQLLCDTLRDYAANKLKGDVTDQQCRQLIVRELEDIKTKIDALARKDLLSSINFLKEGMCLLNISLDKQTFTFGHKQKGCNSQSEEHIVMEANGYLHDAGQLAVVEVASLERSQQIVTSNTISATRLTRAEASFKIAREKATEAFSNEALSTEDRILATKLRMMARILETLKDPDAAAETCKLYLEDLHDVPAIREMFLVYLGSGRIKSHFNKSKRRDNVVSVMMINFALFDFTKMIANIPLDLFNWPRIKLDEQTYHPIMPHSQKMLSKVNKSGAKLPNRFAVDGSIDPSILAINSNEEIIGKNQNASATSLNVVSRDAMQLFYSFRNEDTEAIDGLEILSLAIDEEDNVHVVVACSTPNSNCYNYKLIVLDAKGSIKYQFQLEFLNGEKLSFLSVAVDKDKRIIIHRDNEECLWVCDSRGQLPRSFRLDEQFYDMYLSIPNEPKGDRSLCLSISDKNEIIVAPCGGKTIYIYSVKGALKQTFEVVEGHEVIGLAFSNTAKKVIIATQFTFMAVVNNFLSSYLVTGEPQGQALQLPFKGSCKLAVTSHPTGPIALVHEKGVLFI